LPGTVRTLDTIDGSTDLLPDKQQGKDMHCWFVYAAVDCFCSDPIFILYNSNFAVCSPFLLLSAVLEWSVEVDGFALMTVLVLFLMAILNGIGLLLDLKQRGQICTFLVMG
jgi:hypothetical protein